MEGFQVDIFGGKAYVKPSYTKIYLFFFGSEILYILSESINNHVKKIILIS